MPFKKIDSNFDMNTLYQVGWYQADGNFAVHCARKTFYGWVTSCGTELKDEPTHYQEIYVPAENDDKPHEDSIDFDMTAWVRPDELEHIRRIIEKNNLHEDYCIGASALECLYYLDNNFNLVISNDLSKPAAITVTEKSLIDSIGLPPKGSSGPTDPKERTKWKEENFINHYGMGNEGGKFDG
jgi:hypothetical protein